MEHRSVEYLDKYGIPYPPRGFAKNANEAVAIAEKLGFPVVLKVVFPDITHKSDVGGVINGLNDTDEVKISFNRALKLLTDDLMAVDVRLIAN